MVVVSYVALAVLATLLSALGCGILALLCLLAALALVFAPEYRVLRARY